MPHICLLLFFLLKNISTKSRRSSSILKWISSKSEPSAWRELQYELNLAQRQSPAYLSSPLDASSSSLSSGSGSGNGNQSLNLPPPQLLKFQIVTLEIWSMDICLPFSLSLSPLSPPVTVNIILSQALTCLSELPSVQSRMLLVCRILVKCKCNL